MSSLFAPFDKFGLKNRAIMAPMTRCGCDDRGLPSVDLENYYIRRSENSLGLIIVESAAINGNSAGGYKNGLQFHSQEHLAAWKVINKKVKAKGSKIWIQLFHAGRLTVKEITGVSPVAPSAIKTFDSKSFWRPEVDGAIVHFQTMTPYRRPKKMSEEQISEIIEQFAASCSLAEEAGFDGVELHGAHGYLLHQFSSQLSNKRIDSFEAKSLKFIDLLTKACRSAVSDDFVLCYRLSLHMVDNSYIRYNPGEMDYEKLITLLDKNGIDVFHSSELKAGGVMFGGEEALCELIRSHTNKPIIVCGRISKLTTAEKLLTSKKADLVAFGRALIPNDSLVKDFASGSEKEVIRFDYNQHMFPIQ